MYGCPIDRENKQSGVERNKDRYEKRVRESMHLLSTLSVFLW